MPTFASTTVTQEIDGVPYSTAVPLTSNEADLSNSPAISNGVPVIYNQAILAIVQMIVQGSITSETSYVVLQTDLGDSVWVDVAWCRLTSTASGTNIFTLSAGVAGANSVQQTRAAGSAPASNGSNQIPLGGRIRFIGAQSVTAGSSSSSGQIVPGVTVTIRYKLLGLS